MGGTVDWKAPTPQDVKIQQLQRENESLRRRIADLERRQLVRGVMRAHERGFEALEIKKIFADPVDGVLVIVT